MLTSCLWKRGISVTPRGIFSNIPYNIEVHHACNRPAMDQVISLNMLLKSNGQHDVRQSEMYVTKAGISLCSFESAVYLSTRLKCSGYWGLLNLHTRW